MQIAETVGLNVSECMKKKRNLRGKHLFPEGGRSLRVLFVFIMPGPA